jgi:hypothetical protein
MDLATVLAQLEEARRNPAGVTAMVEQLAQDDPNAQLVLQYLRQRQAQANSDDPRPTTKADRRYQSLREAYDQLYSLVMQLARALGACPRCWGEGTECPVCDGNGSPGSTEPHEPSFDRFVRPALEWMSSVPARNGNGHHLERRQLPESSPPQED